MTKKLVTILAEELTEWPEGGVDSIGQAFDGTLHFDGAHGQFIRHSTLQYTICEDLISDMVNRAEWKAERDRMQLESQQERDAYAAYGVAARSAEDQALWDKVAIASTQAFITAHVTHFGHENVWESTELVSCAADYADAFMAERAKRMKG